MMKHTVIVMLVSASLLVSACLGRSTPTVPPSPVPLFTATQSGAAPTATLPAPTLAPPTETAAPSETPTGTAETPTATTTATATISATAPATLASATPAVTATPDPNEAVGDVVYQDKLDGNGGWFWTFSDDVADFGVVDGKLKGTMKKANSGWRFTISPDTAQLGSQQVSLNAHTVSCKDNDEYGLMLRLKADPSKTTFDGDLFKLRCSGAASFQVISGTQTSTIVDWTASPAIKTGAPADNTLLVWAAGSEFRCYVNGQYLFTANDSTLASGFYGIYIYDRSAGGETVTYDTLVAKAVNK